jgi:hypothetical protein
MFTTWDNIIINIRVATGKRIQSEKCEFELLNSNALGHIQFLCSILYTLELFERNWLPPVTDREPVLIWSFCGPFCLVCTFATCVL